MPPDDGRWGEFPRTVLHFATGLSIDLRVALTAETRAALAEMGFERSFGIVTAADPMGQPQPDAVNVQLATKLQRDVAAMGVRLVAVEACNPERTHCEHSLAIELELQPLVALACQYDQLAVFWFDGDTFWIVPARSSASALRLPA